MDNLTARELMAEVLAAAKKKAQLSVIDLLLRGVLAGAFLGYATSLAFIATSQGLPPLVAALIFPVGFVMLVLLGTELATGNFATLFAALLDRRISSADLLRNWTWVYLGNLAGSLFYAILFYAVISNLGSNNGSALGEQIRLAAQKKTLAYLTLGASGWSVALIKGILCNWMVTVGTVLAFVSRSTIGKICAMWLPITTFFALGYEHSIVNMFVIPTGMLLGAPISISQWWIWNQIPVTLGNIASGALCTGAVLWYTYLRTPVKESLAQTDVLLPVERASLERSTTA
jgi:formate transporter